MITVCTSGVLHSDAVSTLATVHIMHNLQTEHQFVQGLYHFMMPTTEPSFAQLEHALSNSAGTKDKGREGGNAALQHGVGRVKFMCSKGSYTVCTSVQPLRHIMNYSTFLTKSISWCRKVNYVNMQLDSPNLDN